jgi:hypothetical protein
MTWTTRPGFHSRPDVMALVGQSAVPDALSPPRPVGARPGSRGRRARPPRPSAAGLRRSTRDWPWPGHVSAPGSRRPSPRKPTSRGHESCRGHESVLGDLQLSNVAPVQRPRQQVAQFVVEIGLSADLHMPVHTAGALQQPSRIIQRRSAVHAEVHASAGQADREDETLVAGVESVTEVAAFRRLDGIGKDSSTTSRLASASARTAAPRPARKSST